MKSLYQDPEFAAYWNERAGDRGEEYKHFVLDPCMFEVAGDLNDQVILELGCGNGYLAQNFLARNPKKILLLDISEENLKYARTRYQDSRIELQQQDAERSWSIPSDYVDLVWSTMLLNEVADIKTPMKEAFRVLKPNGRIVLSVTHPAWDLFLFAQEQAGKPSERIKGLGNYFRRGFSKYIMGKSARTNPQVARKTTKDFELEHYQRPISDYLNALLDAGFRVRKMIEPEVNRALLDFNPLFQESIDYPINLVFKAEKEI